MAKQHPPKASNYGERTVIIRCTIVAKDEVEGLRNCPSFKLDKPRMLEACKSCRQERIEDPANFQSKANEALQKISSFVTEPLGPYPQVSDNHAFLSDEWYSEAVMVMEETDRYEGQLLEREQEYYSKAFASCRAW